MTQLKCNHIWDWHTTERRMLSVKKNTSVWKKEQNEAPLWQCTLCDERLFIDPRGKVARRTHDAEKHPDTLPQIFHVTSSAQIGRKWQERAYGVLQVRSWTS